MKRLLLAVLLLSVGLSGGIVALEMARPQIGPRTASVRLPADGVAVSFTEGQLSGWLVRQADGSLAAFSAASTHRGQPVMIVLPNDPLYDRIGPQYHENAPGLFRDVIGSMWRLDGTRIFGPASRGLDAFQVNSVDGEWVTINLAQLRLGACSPQVTFHGRPFCSTLAAPRYIAPRPVRLSS